MKPIAKLIPAHTKYKLADFLSTSCLANQQIKPKIGMREEIKIKNVLALMRFSFA